MLAELINRYGKRAIVIARPYALDSGETLRWTLEIDGQHVPDADVRIQEHPERPDSMQMLLVYGNEEVEIQSWPAKTYLHGPAAVTRRLGELL
jgi:hypothetical protein